MLLPNAIMITKNLKMVRKRKKKNRLTALSLMPPEEAGAPADGDEFFA